MIKVIQHYYELDYQELIKHLDPKNNEYQHFVLVNHLNYLTSYTVGPSFIARVERILRDLGYYSVIWNGHTKKEERVFHDSKEATMLDHD